MTESLTGRSLETPRVPVVDDDRAIPEAVMRAALEPGVNRHAWAPAIQGSLIKALHRALNRTPALAAPEVYAAVPVPPLD